MYSIFLWFQYLMGLVIYFNGFPSFLQFWIDWEYIFVSKDIWLLPRNNITFKYYVLQSGFLFLLIRVSKLGPVENNCFYLLLINMCCALDKWLKISINQLLLLFSWYLKELGKFQINLSLSWVNDFYIIISHLETTIILISPIFNRCHWLNYLCLKFTSKYRCKVKYNTTMYDHSSWCVWAGFS